MICLRCRCRLRYPLSHIHTFDDIRVEQHSTTAIYPLHLRPHHATLLPYCTVYGKFWLDKKFELSLCVFIHSCGVELPSLFLEFVDFMSDFSLFLWFHLSIMLCHVGIIVPICCIVACIFQWEIFVVVVQKFLGIFRWSSLYFCCIKLEQEEKNIHNGHSPYLHVNLINLSFTSVHFDPCISMHFVIVCVGLCLCVSVGVCVCVGACFSVLMWSPCVSGCVFFERTVYIFEFFLADSAIIYQTVVDLRNTILLTKPCLRPMHSPNRN